MDVARIRGGGDNRGVAEFNGASNGVAGHHHAEPSPAAADDASIQQPIQAHELFPDMSDEDVPRLRQIALERWTVDGAYERCPQRFPADSLTSLLDVVERFGGGFYKFAAIDASGRFFHWYPGKGEARIPLCPEVPSKSFLSGRAGALPVPVRPVPAAPLAPPGPPPDPMQPLLALLMEGQRQTTQIVVAALSRPAPQPASQPSIVELLGALKALVPQPAPPQSRADYLAELKTMREVFAPAGAAGADSLATLRSTAETLDQIRGGSDAGDGGVGAMLGGVSKLIGQFKENQTPPPAAAPPPFQPVVKEGTYWDARIGAYVTVEPARPPSRAPAPGAPAPTAAPAPTLSPTAEEKRGRALAELLKADPDFAAHFGHAVERLERASAAPAAAPAASEGQPGAGPPEAEPSPEAPRDAPGSVAVPSEPQPDPQPEPEPQASAGAALDASPGPGPTTHAEAPPAPETAPAALTPAERRARILDCVKRPDVQRSMLKLAVPHLAPLLDDETTLQRELDQMPDEMLGSFEALLP